MSTAYQFSLRVLLLVVSIALCVLVYARVSPSTAACIQLHFGFYFFVGLVVLLPLSLWLAYRPTSDTIEILWRKLRAAKWALILAVLLSLLQHVHETHFFKVTNDEHVLMSTSKALHEDRISGWRAEVDFIEGETIVGKYLGDKRPLLYPWLLSQVHSLTGYRTANAFLLNGLLGFTFLILLYFWISRYTSQWIGLTSMVIWAGNPLWVQNISGGGFEVLNLTVLLGVLISTCLWMEKPDEKRFAVVVVLCAWLANVRYESILFALVPIGIFFIVRPGRMSWVPWAGAAAPLALLSLILSQIYFHAHPEAFYQSGGEPFISFQYLPGHLQSAIYYLFNLDPRHSNDWILSYFGIVAILLFWIGVRHHIGLQTTKGRFSIVLLFFTAAAILHLCVILCLRWGSWLDVEVARFSLPFQFCLLLALVAVLHFISVQHSRFPIYAFALFAAFFFVFSLPVISRGSHSERLFPGRDIQWMVSILKQSDLPSDALILTQISTLLFTNENFLARRILLDSSTDRNLEEWIRSGRFSEVWVIERLHLDFNQLEWVSELPRDLLVAVYANADVVSSHSVISTRRSNIWRWRLPVTEGPLHNADQYQDLPPEERKLRFYRHPDPYSSP